MENFKIISKETKDEILRRVKENGEVVSKLALEYNVNNRTIYGWLKKEVVKSISFLEYAKLKRENKLLLEMVGRLTMEKQQTNNIKKN
jgi:transposase-like protein